MRSLYQIPSLCQYVGSWGRLAGLVGSGRPRHLTRATFLAIMGFVRGCDAVVAYLLPKQTVRGSNPLTRSRIAMRAPHEEPVFLTIYRPSLRLLFSLECALWKKAIRLSPSWWLSP